MTQWHSKHRYCRQQWYCIWSRTPALASIVWIPVKGEHTVLYHRISCVHVARRQGVPGQLPCSDCLTSILCIYGIHIISAWQRLRKKKMWCDVHSPTLPTRLAEEEELAGELLPPSMSLTAEKSITAFHTNIIMVFAYDVMTFPPPTSDVQFPQCISYIRID